VTSNVDVLKYILSLVLISAGVVAFYQFSEYSQLYRVLGMVAIVIVVLETAALPIEPLTYTHKP
jgi:preprotein translocase subunit SecE